MLASRYRVLVAGDHAVSLALVFPELSTWDCDGSTVLEERSTKSGSDACWRGSRPSAAGSSVSSPRKVERCR
jgi:hypothetical protein